MADHLHGEDLFTLQVYVSLAKKKVLQCTDLDAGTLSLLTTFDGDTNLHVVPLWSITQKAMADTLRRLKGRFNMVVGFRPTGWSLGRGQHLRHAWCSSDTCSSSTCVGVSAQRGSLAKRLALSVLSRMGSAGMCWAAAPDMEHTPGDA